MNADQFESAFIALLSQGMGQGLHPAMIVSILEVHKANLVDMIRSPKKPASRIITPPNAEGTGG